MIVKLCNILEALNLNGSFVELLTIAKQALKLYQYENRLSDTQAEYLMETESTEYYAIRVFLPRDRDE